MANQAKACAFASKYKPHPALLWWLPWNIVMQHLLSFLWQVSGVRVQRENKNDIE